MYWSYYFQYNFLAFLCQLTFHIFYTDIYQNNIRSNPHDTFPWNNIFACRTKNAEKFSRRSYNQCADSSIAFIQFQIHHISQAATVCNINHLLFTQFTIAYHVPAPLCLFFYLYYAGFFKRFLIR